MPFGELGWCSFTGTFERKEEKVFFREFFMRNLRDIKKEAL